MNKKIAIIILIGFIIFSSVLTSIIRSATSNPSKPKEEVKETIVDTEAPNLVLKESKMIIYQDVPFNYEAMIVEATDNIDGDLTSKVEHNVIDTSEVGEYELEYKVKDKAGNESKQVINVIVKESLPVAGD